MKGKITMGRKVYISMTYLFYYEEEDLNPEDEPISDNELADRARLKTWDVNMNDEEPNDIEVEVLP
jgi:hypothetical protein